MRIITYIFILLFLFSCSKQKEYALEEPTAQEEITVDEAVYDAKEKKEKEINTVTVSYETESERHENTEISISETEINKDFIQQQLQETINLIGLKNSADLVEELYQDLENTIEKKVKSTNINKNLGVVEIKRIQINEIYPKEDGTSIVHFSFHAKTTGQNTKNGHAIARISNAYIQVDDVIYTDYEIYFENIEVE